MKSVNLDEANATAPSTNNRSNIRGRKAHAAREIFDLVEDQAKVMNMIRAADSPDTKEALRRLVDVLQSWRCG